MSRLIGDSIADRRFIMILLAITGCLATPRHVQALIFRHGMLLASVGVLIGLSAALLLVRILSLASTDPVLVALAVILVILTSALACFVPARRATRVDPMLALRQD